VRFIRNTAISFENPRGIASFILNYRALVYKVTNISCKNNERITATGTIFFSAGQFHTTGEYRAAFYCRM